MNSKTETEDTEVRKIAMGTTHFHVSAFPIEQYKEWDTDCKLRFGDCRWIKMWNDHQRAKDYDFYVELVSRIQQLESEISSLKNQKESEEKTEVVKTMTKVFK